MGGTGIAEEARSQLAAVADPSKAGPMAAYMKTDMPFYGVQKTPRKAIIRSLVRLFPAETHDTYQSNIRSLWEQPHREEKYLAIAYARSFKEFIELRSVPLYRELVVEGAWWDFVDEVAVQLIGPVHMKSPRELEPQIRSWILDEDMWLRRSSIITQLKHKDRTDTGLLSDSCTANFSDREFFIRKAIGWALREFAKTNPSWVRAFVSSNKDAMAPLSLREATKHLS